MSLDKEISELRKAATETWEFASLRHCFMAFFLSVVLVICKVSGSADWPWSVALAPLTLVGFIFGFMATLMFFLKEH